MDPESFDQIVARIAAAPSRRDALKGMGLGILSAVGGTAAGVALTEDAEGKGKGKGKGRNNKKKGGGNGGGDKKKGNGGGGNGGDKNKGNGGGDKNKGGGAEKQSDVSSEIKGKGGKCKKDKQCVSKKCTYKKGDRHKGRCLPSNPGGPCRLDRDCKPEGSICVKNPPTTDATVIGTCAVVY